MKTDLIRDYAKMILVCGLNHKKEEVVITASSEIDYFCKILAEEAFKLGAKNVEVVYSDNDVLKLRYQYSDLDAIEEYEANRLTKVKHYINKGASYITLVSEDPLALEGIDEQKSLQGHKLKMKYMGELLMKFMNNEVKTVVAAVPGLAWAKSIYPDAENPIDKLWDDILACTHSDTGNAVEEWRKHGEHLLNKASHLTDMMIDTLHFKSSNGTDLTVGLCDDALWCTANFTSTKGEKYWSNIPTEEVGAVPHKDKVNGKVVSSLPLFHKGKTISNFELEFKNGQVINYKAETGYEMLKQLIETDDGSRRLGEVALVPFNSRVNNTGVLYKNTLFDENARCHLALGAGYPIGIGGESREYSDLVKKGLNLSSIHVDFMFGCEDLECYATTLKGDQLKIIENGEFVKKEM